MTNRIPQGADGWMRDMERRLIALERRPGITSASQILGPNIGPTATQITDWNSDAATFSGWLWGQEGALNSPDNVRTWIGMTILVPGREHNHGTQVAWSHVDGAVGPDQYQRTFHRSGDVTTFSPWVSTSTRTLGFSATGTNGNYTQTNNGIMTAVTGVSVTPPTGARIARVHATATARSVSNAACFWRLRVVDSGLVPNQLVTPDIRCHNQTDPANALGFAASGDYTAVGAVTQAWIDINVDAAGAGIFVAMANVWVEWFA